MVRTVSQSLGLLLVAATALAQEPGPKPVPMASDRMADSYAIYSQLLPSDAIEWGDAARTVWLVEDATVTQVGNPRKDIKAPAGREADLQALFEDYDRHKDEVISLAANGFHTDLPVRLADAAMQKRFQNPWVPGPAPGTLVQTPEFQHVAGMHSFSQVYFNPSHTLAMVYFGMYCGGLCGEWRWVVLERKDGKWVDAPWVHSFMMS